MRAQAMEPARRTRRTPLLPVAGLAATAVFPFVVGPYLLHVGVTVLLWATLALSWDILARTGQVSLGHAGFFGAGVYSAALAHAHWGAGVIPGMLLAAVVAALLALVLGTVTLRLEGIYFAIATLAFGEVLRTLVTYFEGATGGPMGIGVPPMFGGNRVAAYYLVALLLVLAVAASYVVGSSRVRLALTCMRTNPQVAEALGVPTVKIKIALFVVSSSLVGMAGAAYIHYVTFAVPQEAFNLGISLSSVVASIFGGLYSTSGPLVGNLLLKSAEEYLRITVKYGHPIVYGLVLVLAVLFMPGGVVGVVKRWRSWK